MPGDLHAPTRRKPGQDKSSSNIQHKSQSQPESEHRYTSPKSLVPKLTEKQGGHQHCLHRPNTAAGFLNADHAIRTQSDDIPLLDRRKPHQRKASTDPAATPRIKDWTMPCSRGTGHGTAINVNVTGNQKCRTQGATAEQIESAESKHHRQCCKCPPDQSPVG
jgi:hypothetical protein